MKKLSVVVFAALIAALSVVPAMAGPSRAIIQEMGSVIGKDEVNIDLSWSGSNAAGGAAQVGNSTNLSVGGISLDSVNVGIADNVELRLGRTPGLRNYLNLAVGEPDLIQDTNPLGVTLKGAIPGVKGLAAYIAYGSYNDENVAGDTVAKGSEVTVGAAYTWAGPVILNADINYTSRKGDSSQPKDNTFAVAAAALYPLKSNVLVGGELHYATVDANDITLAPGVVSDVKTNILVPALGARVFAGNWTIDAIALLNVNADTDLDAPNDNTAKTTVIGVPVLRVNYKF